MIVEPTKCGWIVALAALMSLAGAPALAQKKPGGSTDPCKDAGLQFPAFVYWKVSGSTRTAQVADASGKCSRLLASNAPGELIFSYPVGGSGNRGRVVWYAGTGVQGLDFTVAYSADNGWTINPGPVVTVYEPAECCTLELSKDGSTLYLSELLQLLPNGDQRTAVGKLTLPPVLARVVGSPVRLHVVYEGPPSLLRFAGPAAVNDGQTQLYLGVRAGNLEEIRRIDLATLAWGRIVNSGTGTNYPNALDTGLGVWTQSGAGASGPSADRVVFSAIPPGLRCPQLFVVDGTGVLRYPATDAPARFGRQPSALDGRILAESQTAPDRRGGCSSTGSIATVDAATGAQLLLLPGLVPDGR